MGIVIPPRTDPYTGQTIITTQDNYNDLMARYNADQSFQSSFGQGIPGMTAPLGPASSIPMPGRPVYSTPEAGSQLPQMPGGMPGGGMGRAPPPSFGQPPAFGPPGRYGQQAMGMAGLLGTPPQQQNPGGLLGGGRRGFRIPGGK